VEATQPSLGSGTEGNQVTRKLLGTSFWKPQATGFPAVNTKWKNTLQDLLRTARELRGIKLSFREKVLINKAVHMGGVGE
jgi:hypothetical protein